MIETGIAMRKFPGQNTIGDACFIKSFDDGALIAVIDGLGHGFEAEQASKKTVSVLEEFSEEPVSLLFTRCNERIRDTRGVVMNIAKLYYPDNTLNWAGIGNVEGLLATVEHQRVNNILYLTNQPGIVGYRIPAPRPVTLPIDEGDILIMATDGVKSGFEESLMAIKVADDPVQKTAERIITTYSRETDDALILVARYLRT